MIPVDTDLHFISPDFCGAKIDASASLEGRIWNNSLKGEYVVEKKIRPVGDRVVVKPAAKEEITKSGIVIPDTAKEKPQEGTVIAVGSGRLLDNGDRAAIDVREGDRVLFAKYGGTEFKMDWQEYMVLKESDILAIIG